VLASRLLALEAVVSRLARPVAAIHLLHHELLDPLPLERVAPGAEASAHVRGEAHVLARSHDRREVPHALEQAYLQERDAVELQEVDCDEDLAWRGPADEGVVHFSGLEIRLVAG